jgi:hypothetical protein
LATTVVGELDDGAGVVVASGAVRAVDLIATGDPNLRNVLREPNA